MDLDQIRKNYESFEDYKIEHFAKNEAGSLRPEVVLILKEEIIKRGLDPKLISIIDTQTKEISIEQLSEFKSKITNLACPECGQHHRPLIGVLIREVKSFILFTQYKEFPLILCPDCAKNRRKKAINTTALMGWWGIPWGFIRTLQALTSSMKDEEKSDIISDAILTQFVLNNIGEITDKYDKEDELIDYVKHINNLNF